MNRQIVEFANQSLQLGDWILVQADAGNTTFKTSVDELRILLGAGGGSELFGTNLVAVGDGGPVSSGGRQLDPADYVGFSVLLTAWGFTENANGRVELWRISNNTLVDFLQFDSNIQSEISKVITLPTLDGYEIRVLSEGILATEIITIKSVRIKAV